MYGQDASNIQAEANENDDIVLSCPGLCWFLDDYGVVQPQK